jgi:hypothetical protein
LKVIELSNSLELISPSTEISLSISMSPPKTNTMKKLFLFFLKPVNQRVGENTRKNMVINPLPNTKSIGNFRRSGLSTRF